MFTLCYIFTKPNLVTFEIYFLLVNYVLCPTKVLHNWSKRFGSISCEYQLSRGLLCRKKWVKPIFFGVLLTLFEPIFYLGIADSFASLSSSDLSVIGSSTSLSISNLGVTYSSSSSSESIMVSFGCVVSGPPFHLRHLVPKYSPFPPHCWLCWPPLVGPFPYCKWM